MCSWTARTLPEKTHEIVQAGVALVPEGRQLFAQMTVAENLELGGWLLPKAERARRLEQAFDDFPKLRERAQQLAGTMSGGEQQMVAVARAMMSAPRLLMLDEPSLGLAPRMVDELLAHGAPHRRRRHHGADGRAERARRRWPSPTAAMYWSAARWSPAARPGCWRVPPSCARPISAPPVQTRALRLRPRNMRNRLSLTPVQTVCDP